MSAPVHKSGPPVAKILLGCGCAGLLLAALIALGTTLAGWLWAKKTYEQNQEAIQESAQALRDLKQAARTLERAGQAAPSAGVPGVPGVPNVSGVPGAQPDELARWASSPLSPEQARAHLAFMTQWEGSKVVTELKQRAASLSELEREQRAQPQAEPSVAQRVRIVSQGVSLVSGGAEATAEFERMAQTHGGAQEILRRTFVAVSLTAAAQDLAAARSIKDAASDQVAKAMRQERAPAAARFEALRAAQVANLKLARAVAESGGDAAAITALTQEARGLDEAAKEAAAMLNEAAGLLLLGRLDDSALTTWQALSIKERRAMMQVASTLPTIPQLALIPQLQSRKLLAAWLATAELTREVSQALGADPQVTP